MSDDDDPVIAEYDLYASSELRENAFLLQFPLISREDPPLNFDVVWFDKDKDKYHFLLPNPTELIGAEIPPRYLAGQNVKMSANLAIGVIHNGQIHLSPITKMVQARPLTTEMDSQKESELGDPLLIEPLSSIDMFMSHSDESISKDIRVTTYRDSLSGSQAEFNREMCIGIDDATASSRGPRFQLFHKLAELKVILFDKLINDLHIQAHTDDLIPILLRYAYYVQGRWVLRSEFLTESELPTSLRIARNFIIVLFHSKKILTMSLFNEFCRTFSVDTNDRRRLMAEIGVTTLASNLPYTKDKIEPTERIVAFKYPENADFEKNHKETMKSATNEVSKLKESIIFARQDPHLFDKFMAII